MSHLHSIFSAFNISVSVWFKMRTTTYFTFCLVPVQATKQSLCSIAYANLVQISWQILWLATGLQEVCMHVCEGASRFGLAVYVKKRWNSSAIHLVSFCNHQSVIQHGQGPTTGLQKCSTLTTASSNGSEKIFPVTVEYSHCFTEQLLTT